MARRLCAWARACAARTISLQCLAINHLLVAVSMQGSAPPRRPFVPLLSPSLLSHRGGSLQPTTMSIPSRLGLGVWFWFPPHRTPEMFFPLQKKKMMDRVKPDRIELRQRGHHQEESTLHFHSDDHICPHVTKKNRDLTAVVAESERRKKQENVLEVSGSVSTPPPRPAHDRQTTDALKTRPTQRHATRG